MPSQNQMTQSNKQLSPETDGIIKILFNKPETITKTSIYRWLHKLESKTPAGERSFKWIRQKKMRNDINDYHMRS